MNNKQCSYWSLTINENASCFSLVQSILDNLLTDNPNIEFSYIYHLPDDDIDNKHIHLVLYFKGKVKRFSTIQTYFNGAHIECTNQQRYKRCIQYLIHKNNPEKVQYKQNEIISNIEVSLLADILNSDGYDFEFFNEAKIWDYMNEFYLSNKEVNASMFVNRFGLSAISKFYFVINDMCKQYTLTLIRANKHINKLTKLDLAFEKYINDGANLKLEWQLACYHYNFKGDLQDYKNGLYRDFVDSVNRGDLDIETILKEEK